MIYIIAIAIIVIIVFILLESKKKKDLKTKLISVEEKIIELNQYKVESDDALLRMEEICRTANSKELLDLWKEEYEAIQDMYFDLKEIEEELKELLDLNKAKQFKEKYTFFEEKYDDTYNSLKEIHDKLMNYTNYEMKNTEIAIDLKARIKELSHEAEINLINHEGYANLKSTIDSVHMLLVDFEKNQKNGKYTEARNLLKEANDIINIVIITYDYLHILKTAVTNFEENLNIINQVKEEIEKLGYTVSYKRVQLNLNHIQEEVDKNSAIIDVVDFVKEVSAEEKEQKVKELKELDELMDSVRNNLEVEYEDIKKIIDKKEVLEELQKTCKELIDGTIEEIEEISKLYSSDELGKIEDFNEEVENYNQFEEDYKKLLTLIDDNKDEYSELYKKLQQSEGYVNKFLNKLKEVVLEIKNIRVDEITVRDEMAESKELISKLELYLRNQNHYYEKSENLENSLSELYKKLEIIDKELEKTPLNIELVRKNSYAAEKLMETIVDMSEKEIKRKLAVKELLPYINVYISDDETETIVMHINTLFNNRDYQTALKEINHLIKVVKDGNDMLYKKVVSTIQITRFADYINEEF